MGRGRQCTQNQTQLPYELNMKLGLFPVIIKCDAINVLFQALMST